MNKNCGCDRHLKADEELKKMNHTILKCVGHGEGCPCIKSEVIETKLGL